MEMSIEVLFAPSSESKPKKMKKSVPLSMAISVSENGVVGQVKPKKEANSPYSYFHLEIPMIFTGMMHTDCQV